MIILYLVTAAATVFYFQSRKQRKQIKKEKEESLFNDFYDMPNTVCPRCKSLDCAYKMSPSRVALDGDGIYICKSCKFIFTERDMVRIEI